MVLLTTQPLGSYDQWGFEVKGTEDVLLFLSFLLKCSPLEPVQLSRKT